MNSFEVGFAPDNAEVMYMHVHVHVLYNTLHWLVQLNSVGSKKYTRDNQSPLIRVSYNPNIHPNDTKRISISGSIAYPSTYYPNPASPPAPSK